MDFKRIIYNDLKEKKRKKPLICAFITLFNLKIKSVNWTKKFETFTKKIAGFDEKYEKEDN